MCLIVLYIVVNPLEGKSVLSSHPVLKSSRLLVSVHLLLILTSLSSRGLLCDLLPQTSSCCTVAELVAVTEPHQ